MLNYNILALLQRALCGGYFESIASLEFSCMVIADIGVQTTRLSAQWASISSTFCSFFSSWSRIIVTLGKSVELSPYKVLRVEAKEFSVAFLNRVKRMAKYFQQALVGCPRDDKLSIPSSISVKAPGDIHTDSI